jgi:ATP synthase protein I
MTGKDGNHGKEELRRAAEIRETRSRHWAEEGERPLWKNLSMVGSLGWLIVTPTLLGVLLGRWLDDLFGTGTLFTGALIFVGAATGASLAWHRMNNE